jgi:hypothetical protein
MGVYENHHDQEAQQQNSDRYEYDRDVTIPELMRRLPDGEVTTCEQLDLDVECCDICHSFYPHYEMEIVDLPDGRKAWMPPQPMTEIGLDSHYRCPECMPEYRPDEDDDL